MKKLRVLMIQTTNSGVAYYRMQNFVRAAYRTGIGHWHHLWWQKNITESTHPWEQAIVNPQYYASILGELNYAVRQSDIIICQMVHTAPALDLFHSIKEAYPDKILLSEIDDNMISVAPYNPAHDCYAPGTDPRRLAVAQFKASDGIVTSTPYLAEIYQEFCPNTYVAPNCIDFTEWAKVRKRKKGGIRIGWAAGASHEEDLRIVENVAKKLMDEFRDVCFIFVHGIPQWAFAEKRVIRVPKFVPILNYPQHLANQAFDIGIAPLVDSAFNRGKSNLRYLEYSALAIPTVASKVGHFKETLKHCENALLCDTEQDWYDNLRRLIVDRTFRNELGQRAHNHLQQHFDVDKGVANYTELLHQAIKRGPCGKVPVVKEEGDVFTEQEHVSIGSRLPESAENWVDAIPTLSTQEPKEVLQ